MCNGARLEGVGQVQRGGASRSDPCQRTRAHGLCHYGKTSGWRIRLLWVQTVKGWKVNWVKTFFFLMKDRVGSTRTHRKRDKLWKINDKPSKYETTARPEPKVRNPADEECERLHSLSFWFLLNLKLNPGLGFMQLVLTVLSFVWPWVGDCGLSLDWLWLVKEGMANERTGIQAAILTHHRSPLDPSWPGLQPIVS